MVRIRDGGFDETGREHWQGGRACTQFLIMVLMTHPVVLAESAPVIEVGLFSAETAVNPLPANWKPFNFKNIERHTHYRLIEENGRIVREGGSLNATQLPV